MISIKAKSSGRFSNKCTIDLVPFWVITSEDLKLKFGLFAVWIIHGDRIHVLGPRVVDSTGYLNCLVIEILKMKLALLVCSVFAFNSTHKCKTNKDCNPAYAGKCQYLY